MEREIYPVAEFCQRYAISRTSFYREIQAKRLSIIKRGRRTGVTRAESERWLAALSTNNGGHHAAQ